MDTQEIENLRKRIHYTKSKCAIDFKSSFLTKIRESEANQLTVTRLAGSDEILKKQVKIFRSDMSSTINDITRQQKQLRRSLKQYSKKLKRSKKERKKREKLSQDLEELSGDGLPLDIITEEPEVRSDCEESNTNNSVHENEFSDGNVQTSEDVPTCADGEDMQSENATEGNNNDIAFGSPINTPMTMLTQNLQRKPNEFVNVHVAKCDDSLMNDIDIKFYSKRKRQKRNSKVCYSDLVKLQHSTNRRQLLGLVDKLAKLHGISDNQFKSSNHKTKQPSSEPLRRNSLYYTINYGYDVPDIDKDEQVKNELKVGVKAEKDQELSTQFRETEPPDNHIFSHEDNRFWREIHRERLSRQTLLSNQNDDSLSKSRGKIRRERQKNFSLMVDDYVTMDRKVPSYRGYKLSEKTETSSSMLFRRRYTYLPPITNISK